MSPIDRSPALTAVRTLFHAYPYPYWVAGGWALDLFADRFRRPHGDVDVIVLARDLDEIAKTFTSPRPMVELPETGVRRSWAPGEVLTPGPHALVFPDDPHPSPIQILFAASDADEWVYHRGRGTIRKPLAEITLRSPDGIPYRSHRRSCSCSSHAAAGRRTTPTSTTSRTSSTQVAAAGSTTASPRATPTTPGSQPSADRNGLDAPILSGIA